MATKEKKMKVEEEIQHLLKDMEKTPSDSDEYKSMANNVKILCEARSYKTKSDMWIELLFPIGAYFLGTLMVIGHEEIGNVISTKAFGNIPKLFR
jgi:hypothetical protein